ncbi:MAG: CoA transferase [Anaerolineae bacterium]|nr:CoA transferase [Anaerolineae bacterium]
MKALDDVRVIDLGHVLAAPTTAMILADLGADVIHFESPRGDDARHFGPFSNGQSGYFASINRNKRSMVVDLKKPAGKTILQDLIRVSDVVLENFRPGALERLGFSYEAMREINPRIIYASICGFGHDALPEYGSKPAYDLVAQAYSGLMSITGPENGSPVRVGTSVGDITAGHQCAIAILAALWYRERTGKGQIVDMSMVDGLVYILENAIVRYTLSGQIPQPLGTRHPTITPFQAFPTADNWIVIAIGNDTLWNDLCAMLGRPDLAEDERFQTNALRTANQGALNEILAPITRQKTTAEWMAILEAHKLPYSPINSVDQVVQDPNIRYRGMVVEVDQPGMGPIEIVGSPFHLSETPGTVRTPAPLLGEHTKEILSDLLAYPAEQIQALIEAGVAYVSEGIGGQ